MVKKSKFAKQFGFSTIEILIAASILIVVFSAVILLVMGSQRLGLDTELAHEANLLNQQMLESARAASFDTDAASLVGTTPEGLFNKSMVENAISPCSKKITARVDWVIEGRDQYVTATTVVTNPAQILSTGQSCLAGPPPGGTAAWQNCTTDYAITDVQPAGIQASDIDIFKINGTKYLAWVSQHSSDPTPDFWLFQEASGGFTPKLLPLDMVGSAGASAVSVPVTSSGTAPYAYVVTGEGSDQLRVIDISNLDDPVQIAQLSFAGNNPATDIVKFNNFLYISAGKLVYKVNVSNPLVPTLTGSVNVKSTINKLNISSGRLLVATDSEASEKKQLYVVDLSSLNILGAYGNNVNNQNGTAVFGIGSKLYLGMSKVNNKPDLFELNISSSGVPTLSRSKDLNHNAQSKIIDIVVYDQLIFIGSTKEEFEVWNLSAWGIATSPQCAHNTAQQAAALELQDNAVYGALRSNKSVRRYIDPNNPPQ